LAVIPPKCPTLQKSLEKEGYEVRVQALAYSHGGGFLRCLTLFSDVKRDFKRMTMDRYDELVMALDSALESAKVYAELALKTSKLPITMEKTTSGPHELGLLWGRDSSGRDVHMYQRDIMRYQKTKEAVHSERKATTVLNTDLIGDKRSSSEAAKVVEQETANGFAGRPSVPCIDPESSFFAMSPQKGRDQAMSMESAVSSMSKL
jgi:hypothetical protein